jgi:hypothetical protein
MPWTFQKSVESNHAPPPSGYVSLSLVFMDDASGGERSILVYLPSNYSEEQLSDVIIDTKTNLDSGEL